MLVVATCKRERPQRAAVVAAVQGQAFFAFPGRPISNQYFQTIAAAASVASDPLDVNRKAVSGRSRKVWSFWARSNAIVADVAGYRGYGGEAKSLSVHGGCDRSIAVTEVRVHGPGEAV